MGYKPKILAFAGSLRRDSYNKKLVKNAIRGAESAGAEITYIDLYDYPLPLYNADVEEKEGLPPHAIKIKELLWKNDGFIIASPEYNSSISGVLKNTLDWASRKASQNEIYLSCFIDKVALLLSASPGYFGGLRGLVHLRSILENVNTFVLPEQKIIPNAAEAFDTEGNLKNNDQKESVEALGKKLTETISRLKK